jgi:hypothetical protein
MNDTPLGVEDFSAFRCHYSTGKGMQQVTLLFTGISVAGDGGSHPVCEHDDPLD